MMLKIDLWSVLVVNKLKNMKPLLKKDLPAFIQRFENFKDAEFRSLKVLSPSEMRIDFALQDAARDYDWISISLEFTNVTDASIVNEDKIHLLDMSGGASLFFKENFTFKITNTSFYIKASSIKFQEDPF